MSRINTNIQSLAAQSALGRNQNDLNTRLSRLSTGLKINSGKDDPAGLIASETLRSEIAGINQAVDNSARANNVINTAEGALNEVSALLLNLQSLTNQSANTGGLSTEEISANQLQVDSILTSINRISNTTEFAGMKLLNGSLDYTLSGVSGANIINAHIYAAKLPENGSVPLTVNVTGSARTGTVPLTGAGIGASATTISVQGSLGLQQISFAASTHNSAIVAAVNQYKSSTGVSAALSGSALRLDSTRYGSKGFVQVATISGSFTSGKSAGVDATVAINGVKASVDGLTASLRSGDLDITLDLSKTFGQQTTTGTAFQITGGGARFQLGSTVNLQSQVQLGLASTSTSTLGDRTVGFLSAIGSDGDSSLIHGNTIAAQRILTESIKQVSQLRGRLGAFQKNVLETNVNSLNVALENVTSAESSIRDSDFAKETAALTRAQILVQANQSVLQQANSAPQSVLSLLRS